MKLWFFAAVVHGLRLEAAQPAAVPAAPAAPAVAAPAVAAPAAAAPAVPPAPLAAAPAVAPAGKGPLPAAGKGPLAPVAPAGPPVPVVKLGLTVPGLKLAGPDLPALHLGAQSEFSISSDAQGALVVSAPAGEVMSVRQGELHVAVPVSAGLIDVGGVKIAGVKQWALAVQDDFSDEAKLLGWSHTSTSSCAGLTMLGGYCNFAQGDVTRTVSALPPHKQVRIQATYHFIDRWVGETAFVKMNIGVGGVMVPVWTDSHSQDHEKHGMNVCGSEAVHEGKFAARVDVSVPHTSPDIVVAFGSTMDAQDPCDESWGISNFEVYVK